MALSALEIKVEILKRGDTVAGLARKWNATPEIVSRVIHRRYTFVYPEIRAKLAKYLGVPVSAVGREPQRERPSNARAA
ncbi:MAG TPA: hypothetical protein VK421_06265 [Pyrinomonadaceae bacterium]|nr:hypothetical protein [Pyrinomonadaceae bacterium]